MDNLLTNLSETDKNRLKPAKFPEWMDPMLATLTDKRFSKPNWIFERKLDGERCLAFREKNNVSLMSRNRKQINETYPEIVDALQQETCGDFVVDGEIVAFEGNVTSFSKLQQRMHLTDSEKLSQIDITVYYYIFDLLYLEGFDLTHLGLRQRKKLLKDCFSFDDPLRWTLHRNESGEEFFEHACKKGWEGIIAKKADSEYVHKRSKNWLKFKCSHQQEFVIGGYTDPKGSRIGFGALLLGYYEGDFLKYAGRVGTGFTDDLLEKIAEMLVSLKQKRCPFVNKEDMSTKTVHWVSPKLVGDVAFTEWTNKGKLRHPRFKGLRRDKEPQQVIREKPEF